MDEFLCPFCHSKIPTDDVNVAKDLALCRACGRTTAFSIVSGAEEIALDSLDEPPRCVRVEKGFNDEMTVIYHRLSPVLFFLIPFTAIWSGGSMSAIIGTQIKKGTFSVEESLFALPFAIGTVVLLSVIAYLMFGKWVVSLSRGQGSVFVGVGPLGSTRRFSYDKTTLVSMCMTNMSVNNRPQKGILVRTNEKDFVFGAFIKDDAKRFIAAAILQQVGRL